MNAQQMIEVLQAYERGEKIQIRMPFSEDWVELPYQAQFDFTRWVFRIAPKEKKPTKFLAWVDPGGEVRHVSATFEHPNQLGWKRVPSLDLEGVVEE